MNLGIPGVEDVEEIGRGGFAVVFRARQPAFERDVAIKVVTAGIDELAAQRFERECVAIGALSGHPNIVTVYDVGKTDDGRPCITMEFLPGGSLADVLARQGPRPWQEVVDIGVKLCGALESAHRASVLHRDLKPENVLMSRYGEPKLADFGIARIEGKAETKSGVITASPAHAPPEILNGERASVVADVYSLASTLFALITGHGPFEREDDDTVFAIYSRIATDSVPDLREHGVPDPIAAAIEQGLSKDPAGRPGSAAEFASILQDAQAAVGLPRTMIPLEVATEGAAGASGVITRVTGPASRSAVTSTTGPAARAAPAPAAPAAPAKKPKRGETSMSERERRMKRSFLFSGVVVVLLIAGIVVLLARSSNNKGNNRATGTTVPKSGQGFADDFSNTASGWQEATDGAGRRHYENGYFVIESLRAGLAAMSFRNDAPELLDSRTEVSAIVAPTTQGSGLYGAVCRFRSAPARSFYFGTIAPNGDWGIYRTSATQAQAAELAVGNLAITPGSHRIGFTCTGTPAVLKLDIDGALIGSAIDDAPLSAGRSGVVVLALREQSFAVHFDDFALSRL